MELSVKKLRPEAKLPTRGSAQAAGYDLYACLDGERREIPPHATAAIPTGLCIAVPDGYFAAVFARSGLAAKEGLRPANCVGVCDSDYRGEYLVMLHNDTEQTRTIASGDRVAQLVVTPYLTGRFYEAEDLSPTQRGAGGFGSTGRN